jgi:hypothetical protein
MAHTDSNENLLGVNLFSVSKSNAVLAYERSHAGNVIDRILLEVTLVDSVETLNVGISLVLECVPVKSRGCNIRESILLGIMDGLGNRG